MIEKLIEYSIRNRFLVLLLAGALTVLAVYAVLNTPVDAIPDLSENQVIVFTDWMGRSPQEIEDQVTYPLSLKLQGLAGVQTVRSTSEFNYSMITIIFEERIPFYFARERVLEKLTLASTFLPPGVVPYLASDSTALGQIFWYTLEGGKLDPGRMWALQKYFIGPELNSVPGVAEVGTAGGLPREYQIDIDPNALRAYNITLGELYNAVARSNSAVGGRTVQKANADFVVRSVGWLTSTRDIEDTVVKQVKGTPLYVKNVARVQVGTGYRRNLYEKDGNDVIGGVVVMRHGENPLTVTERVKKKIQELQPGLPEGVHIVPAYDRTRLIHGAIHAVTEVMWHEMLIAGLAILLILMHVRSVFVICITLPLAVLFAFLQMWLLRRLGILDVQANIMSLAGITISIGILVDQAIVMVENATHHLKEEFGDRKVTGDTRAIVLRACRTVGRPIFFSVLIILISFIPVFAMSGREGKLFHPMAFTKSLAMVGVALISVTVVPALIPTFIKGKLRGEEQNWIVRSFSNIYKPLLTWALPRRNFVMWAFAALLILAVGMFPLQAVFGLGASHYYWEMVFFIVLFAVVFLTVSFTRGWQWQLVSFGTLVLLGLIAYRFPKIGVEFMPALNEGTLMDMPISVPRIGLAQVADDLRARDALLRGFPEVESVIGKAGRADTPTDPAPLEMVETFVNYRPKELWPKRALRFADAAAQVRAVVAALEQRGYLATNAMRLPQLRAQLPELQREREKQLKRPLKAEERAQLERDVAKEVVDERASLINDATMNALSQFDDALRSLALQRYREFEHELGPVLTRFTLEEAVRRFEAAGVLHWPEGLRAKGVLDVLVKDLAPDYGRWLSKAPALEDVTRLCQEVARHLATAGALRQRDSATGAWQAVSPADALALHEPAVQRVLSGLAEALGAEGKTFAGEVHRAVQAHRLALWHEHITGKVNWELFDRGVEALTWAALEEIGRAARGQRLDGAIHGTEMARFVEQAAAARRGAAADREALRPFVALRQELERPFAGWVFFWQRDGGAKGDLRKELDTVVQVPGWSNIWTQPIANRIDMLSTGVRTPVGVRVFGPDLETIDRVCRQIAEAIKPVRGAQFVVAAPIMGKGYLEITIDRRKAARYGVNVGDIQETIEAALGGKVITQTVEGRDRFPVRIRYARDFREDEAQVRRLLVSASGGRSSSAVKGSMGAESAEADRHAVAPGHMAGTGPVQIPLAELADVRIVEGPSMIPSENGRLRNYVTMTVSGERDLVGFVEEAQRVVAEKVQLPPGVHIEWAGEFEHQVRAARTLRLIFPAVILLIFLILYLTYKDFADAVLMMLAVPEALAGGVFFQFLFPKIRAWDWSAPPMDFTVAVWVGYIAAFGMATETGIIMLVYLREAIEKRGGLENIKSLDELRQAVIEGAVHRLRPKLLTEGVAIVALAPMLFTTGVGSEIMSAMALPVLGGLLIADEVVDIFLPVRFYWVRRARWLKLHERRAGQELQAARLRRLRQPSRRRWDETRRRARPLPEGRPLQAGQEKGFRNRVSRSREIPMAATRRKWPGWLAALAVLLALAAVLWYVHTRGWLEPVYAWFGHAPPKEMAHSGHGGMSMPGMKSMSPSNSSHALGLAEVTIPGEVQQRIGVTTGTVERAPLRMSVRTVGIVEPNETKVSHVHLRTEGWIKEVFVNYTGKQVKQDDPLLTIYSPDFLATQREYLASRDVEGGATGGKQTLAALALQRLELWGVSPREIKQLKETGKPQTYLTLRSPQKGTVLVKNAFPGQHVSPKTDLYVIADLANVWVQARVYEYELPHVEKDQPVTVTVPALPGAALPPGKVVFIQPTVDEKTRTVQVRVELPNKKGLLRPGMFAHVVIEHTMGQGLLVPASAIIRTGERDLAYRVVDTGRFMPVVVQISPLRYDGGRLQVLKGLQAGERVVTSADFLIDSESRLRVGGMAGMAGMDMGGMKGE